MLLIAVIVLVVALISAAMLAEDGEEPPRSADVVVPGSTDATVPDSMEPMVQGVPVGDFFMWACAACHGEGREGLIGPPLMPARLIENDAFYINTVTNGRVGTAMLPYGGGPMLTPEELQSIVIWLKNDVPE